MTKHADGATPGKNTDLGGDAVAAALEELRAGQRALKEAQLADVRKRKEETARLLYGELEAAQRREDERQRREDALRGGPCVFCGVEYSAENTREVGVRPRWFPQGDGAYCVDCRDDRGQVGTRVPLTDLDHRGRVIAAQLGDEALGDWRMPYLQDRVQFRWFHETPGATPGGKTRFAYLDVDALRERLRPVTLEQSFVDGNPCQRCGCAHMYRRVQGSDTHWTQEKRIPVQYENRQRQAVIGYMKRDEVVRVEPGREYLSCAGCNGKGYNTGNAFDDLCWVIERLCGVTYTEASVAVNTLGLGRYEQLPEDDPRRKLTLTPFAYLGDIAELRRRVAEVIEAIQVKRWAGSPPPATLHRTFR